MATPTNSFPEPLQRAFGMYQQGITYAQNFYESAQDTVISASNKVLPESVRPLAAKVVRAVPETFFCASMFTATYSFPALCIWAVKSVSLITPFVTAATQSGGFEKESLKAAFNESKTRFTATVESFKPALVVTGVVGCALSTVVAVARANLYMLATASFFGILAHMAYKAMKPETPGANVVCKPAVSSLST